MAIGAILSFAINVKNTHGFNLNTIGIILMVVGGVGFLLSLVFWSTWGGFHRTTPTVGAATVTPRSETVIRQRDVV
ncbi:MAG TPA: hypothetical protein VFA11_12425 [Acidimicrobiales bacterium]|nr:hypothetical protein [Acidimicrobiales bacterium]